MGNIEFSR